MNFPNTDVFATTTGVYFGGAYFRLCFVDVVRTEELRATNGRLGPGFLPTTTSIGGGWRRRTLLRYPPPSSNPPFLAAKFAHRRPGRANWRWPALGAVGAVPISQSGYSEILSHRPLAPEEVPRANISPRRITRLKCVTPRPGELGYIFRIPTIRTFSLLRPLSFRAGVFPSMFCRRSVFGGSKRCESATGPASFTEGALCRGLLAPPNASGVSESEIEHPCPVSQIRHAKGRTD